MIVTGNRKSVPTNGKSYLFCFVDLTPWQKQKIEKFCIRMELTNFCGREYVDIVLDDENKNDWEPILMEDDFKLRQKKYR